MSKKKISFTSPEDKLKQAEIWIKNEQQKNETEETMENDSSEKREYDNTAARKNNDMSIINNNVTQEQEIPENLPAVPDKVIGLAREKHKRLTIDVPVGLHKAFKRAAITNDEIMSDLLRCWIEAYVKDCS